MISYREKIADILAPQIEGLEKRRDNVDDRNTG